MPSLLTLPPEIRDLIYRLLLTQKYPVSVHSPQRRSSLKNARKPKTSLPTQNQRPQEHLDAILRVNKHIHEKTAPIFYSTNRFVVGIGHYGSTESANLNGLKCFMARVPLRYISLIKRVVLVIHMTPLRIQIPMYPTTLPS
jgi:hypothetical protein